METDITGLWIKLQMRPINVLSLLQPSYSASPLSPCPNIFLSHHALFLLALHFQHLLCRPPLLMLSSILLCLIFFLLLLLLLSCPALLPPLPLSNSFPSPFRGSCSTCKTSPLVVSSHPTINSLFHSHGYDKVIMHGPCSAPAHSWTHTLTHPAPFLLMEVDIVFPLKILWMSSIRESWQPGAPPINLSHRF